MAIELPRSAAGRRALPATALPAPVRAHLAARTGPGGGAAVSGYLYDAEASAGRARALRAALPAWARLCYAVKANAYEPLLAALAPEVDGFEVASAAETDLAVKAAAGGRAGRRPLLVAGG